MTVPTTEDCMKKLRELVGTVHAYYDGVITEQELHEFASEVGEWCDYYNPSNEKPEGA